MKRSISGLLFGMFAAASASAQVVTFDFTGMVKLTREFDPNTLRYTEVPGSTLNGTFIVPGDTFHGEFSIDLATPIDELFYSPPSLGGSAVLYRNNYDSDQPSVDNNRLTLTFDQTGYTTASPPSGYGGSSIYVTDSAVKSGADRLTFVPSFAQSSTGFRETTLLSLYDYSGSMFSTEALPSALNLGATDYSHLFYTFSPVTSRKQLALDGVLTSLTARAISPVPEPSAYAMLALGLLTVGATSYRRKQRHRARSTRA